MQLFCGGDELAKKKDIVNPNLITGSKDFTGNKWTLTSENLQKDKYLDLTAVCVNWAWGGISQYIAVNKGETFTASMYVKAKAGSTVSWYINLPSDEAGYKKVDTNPATKTINGTGNWQKTSITFTVIGDSGAIKPRIESTDSSPYWIAGMKLERGTAATPWCPAPEDYVMKSDKVLTVKNLIQALFSDELVNIVDDNFDMNSAQPGIYRSWGKKPINAPNQCAAWAKYFAVPFIEGNSASMFQVVIDTNGNVFTRVKGGSPANWNSWHTVNLGE